MEQGAQTTRLILPDLVLALAVGLLGIAAYFGVWNLGFASDDVALVFRMQTRGWEAISPFLLPETGAQGVGYQAYYRPLVVLITVAEYAFWGTDPLGYHCTNLLAYGLLCAMLCWLILRVTGSRFLALASASLFALHPLHTMNVAWISGRTDLFAVLLAVACLVAFDLWRGSGRRKWLWICLTLELFALASKEIAYLIPLLGIATEWTKNRGAWAPVIRATAVLWVLPVLSALMVATTTPFVQAFEWALPPAKALENLVGSVVVLAFPLDYELLLSWSDGASRVTLGLTVAVAAVAALWVIWRCRNSNPAILWGAVWLLVGIAPTYRATMRWYLLLPSVGVCLLFAGLCATLPARGRIAAVTLLAFGFLAGLVRERGKWETADAVNRTAVASLVEADSADGGRQLVALTTPAKVGRMPVFGGNTEAFYRINGGRNGVFPVVSHVSLGGQGSQTSLAWLDSTACRLELRDGEGEFLPLLSATGLRHGVPVPGDTLLSEKGVATVAGLDMRNRIVALDVRFTSDELAASRLLLFSGDRFVLVETPESE